LLTTDLLDLTHEKPLRQPASIWQQKMRNSGDSCFILDSVTDRELCPVRGQDAEGIFWGCRS
jgi:hypothetical protein